MPAVFKANQAKFSSAEKGSLGLECPRRFELFVMPYAFDPLTDIRFSSLDHARRAPQRYQYEAGFWGDF